MSNSSSGVGAPEKGPSILDLLRLSTRDLLVPGGEAIYREVALLADLRRDRPKEVIDVACGTGGQLIFLVEEFGAQGSGVDTDPRILERADMRARSKGLSDRIQFQEAPLSALPYRDQIFDVAIGELGLTGGGDPERAIDELVRVTKPGGTIVLLQLVWKSPVPEARRAVLSSHLGARPRMLVEWKQKLESCGVSNLHVSDWSDDQAAFRPRLAKPFPDFAEMFNFREKLSILRRTRRIWGWSGVRTAMECESEVHRLLKREQTLGFVTIKGVRSEIDVHVDPVGVDDTVAGAELPLFRTPGSADPHLEPERRVTAPVPLSTTTAPTPEPSSTPEKSPLPRRVRATTQVRGLPLFSGDEESGE